MTGQLEFDGLLPKTAQKKSRTKKKAAARFGSAAESPDGGVGAQAMPEKSDDPVVQLNAQGPKTFFPCNREDALVLLGSLAISHVFPDNRVRLAVQPAGVAMIEGGVRESEETLLNDGVPDRFVVLVELVSSTLQSETRIIGHDQIAGLWFRTQKESEDFRFRPVDEFDTDTYKCSVDPDLFGQKGEARFSLRHEINSEFHRDGKIADRVASGVFCMLELAATRPVCRDSIVEILSPEMSKCDFNVVTVIEQLCGLETSQPVSRYAREIVAVYAEADRATARSLFEGVAENLSKREDRDEKAVRIESKWTAVAQDVLKSKVVLDGEHLKDAGSIALRSALLAAVADDPKTLCAFLDSENPSGPRVTSAAAFLIGLKQGVLNTSWGRKSYRVREVSGLLFNLLNMLLMRPRTIDRPIVVKVNEQVSKILTEVQSGSHLLAKWEQTRTATPDPVEQQWRADFGRLGWKEISAGVSGHSWIIEILEKHKVEVVRSKFENCSYPTLICRLPEGRKLRKKKDIEDYLRSPGNLWHMSIDSRGSPFFHCDLMALPNLEEKRLLEGKLEECLTHCLIPIKVSRSKRKTEKPIWGSR